MSPMNLNRFRCHFHDTNPNTALLLKKNPQNSQHHLISSLIPSPKNWWVALNDPYKKIDRMTPFGFCQINQIQGAGGGGHGLL